MSSQPRQLCPLPPWSCSPDSPDHSLMVAQAFEGTRRQVARKSPASLSTPSSAMGHSTVSALFCKGRARRKEKAEAPTALWSGKGAVSSSAGSHQGFRRSMGAASARSLGSLSWLWYGASPTLGGRIWPRARQEGTSSRGSKKMPSVAPQPAGTGGRGEAVGGQEGWPWPSPGQPHMQHRTLP